MRQPLAIWNPARGVWEEPQTESLLCEHLALFSGTWPASGMTRNGQVFALPTQAPHTDGSGYSSSPILPTPTSRDWKDGPPCDNVPVNSLLGRTVWDLTGE